LENRFLVGAGQTGIEAGAGIYVMRGDNGYNGAGTYRTITVDVPLAGETDMASAGTVSAADLSTDPAGEVVRVQRNLGAIGSLPGAKAYVTAGLNPTVAAGGGGCFVQSGSRQIGVMEV